MSKIICPNCHLPVDSAAGKCPFCGADLAGVKEEVKEETVAEATEGKGKKKLQKHTFFYLIALGIALACFLAMILPGDGTYLKPIYFWAFQTTVKIGDATIVVGTNAAAICFIFSIIGVLNFAAIFRSIQKKSTEIALFSYFAAFNFVVVAVVAFLSSALLSFNSSGTIASTFTFGFGFAILGVLALVSVAFVVLGVIKYKKFLVESPLETFKE